MRNYKQPTSAKDPVIVMGPRRRNRVIALTLLARANEK